MAMKNNKDNRFAGRIPTAKVKHLSTLIGKEIPQYRDVSSWRYCIPKIDSNAIVQKHLQGDQMTKAEDFVKSITDDYDVEEIRVRDDYDYKSDFMRVEIKAPNHRCRELLNQMVNNVHVLLNHVLGMRISAKTAQAFILEVITDEIISYLEIKQQHNNPVVNPDDDLDCAHLLKSAQDKITASSKLLEEAGIIISELHKRKNA